MPVFVLSRFRDVFVEDHLLICERILLDSMQESSKSFIRMYDTTPIVDIEVFSAGGRTFTFEPRSFTAKVTCSFNLVMQFREITTLYFTITLSERTPDFVNGKACGTYRNHGVCYCTVDGHSVAR
jgi:hypothetical protein